MNKHSLVCALAVALLSSAALAQPAPAPLPDPAPRPTAAPPAPRHPGDSHTYTFQLVLLTADFDGSSVFEHVPANARKALEDLRNFLPYKSYRLLDMAWMRSSAFAEAQLSGPSGVALTAGLRFETSSRDPDRIDIEHFVLRPQHPHADLLKSTSKEEAATAEALARSSRPILESSFDMKAGETVVVGTAKLDGPSRALVVILSALP